MLVPGTLWKQYHVEVGKIMTSELLDLGLLDKPMYKMKIQIGQRIKNISCTEQVTTWD